MTTTASRLASALADRYRIERELGQGGMATVYLAQDLRHDRRVAVKVLRPDLAAVIGAERFLQEIRTTANLQHPHILPLHDSGQVDGSVFYVMPYIDGESLRERITREKQLPIDEALRFTQEVADALGYAHERGIIHRDIKPENILLQRGHALVADFGIALAASRTGGSRMTETGLSLGTPHYMSPEQTLGERELGPRSDVYALGCVCYEMLCGEPPFTGPTPQAIVARVMTEAPRSLRSQRPNVPENVEAAVLQALEKLPADRFVSAAAFAEALRQPGFTRAAEAVRSTPGRARASPWKMVSLGLAGLVSVLTLALITPWRRDDASAPPRPVLRFEVAVPESVHIDQIALTPDGSRLLTRGPERSYFYSFADMRWAAFDVPEFQGFASMSIAPDGDRIAFVGDRRLKTVSLSGGPVRRLAQDVRQVSWETDGFIYFIHRSGGQDRISRIRPEGGAIEELLAEGDSSRQVGLGTLLPTGHLLYSVWPEENDREAQSFALELSTRKSRPVELPPGFSVIAIAPTGHLVVFGRDAVYAVGFDAKRLEVLGAPVPIMSVLPLDVDLAAGMLVYSVAPPGGPALFDRHGRRRELPGVIVPGAWGFAARVSPSGHAIAFGRFQAPSDRRDVFTYRLPDGPLLRLTSDSVGQNFRPTWASDGQLVQFLATVRGRTSGFRVPWDASGPVDRFLTRPADLEEMDPLPDGRVVVLERGRGLLLVSPGNPDSAVTLVGPESLPLDPRVSPDGRWLAYSASELGRREVFVRPLGGASRRWQISRQGGNNPAWGRSGRELFFAAGDSLRVGAVGPGPEFQMGEVRSLFRTGLLPNWSGLDVLPGDSLFVFYASSQAERERIIVVVNFLEELRALNLPASPGRTR